MDPADPHHLATSPEQIQETVIIALEGNRSEEQLQQAVTAFRAVAGVTQVRPEPDTAHVVITFDPRQTNTMALHEALERSGYQPAPRTGAGELAP